MKHKNTIKGSKGWDIMKMVILALAVPAGFILSCVLAYLNGGFVGLLKIFDENIFDMGVSDEIMRIVESAPEKWCGISVVMAAVGCLLLLLYAACNRKKNTEEDSTWGKTLISALAIILISQVVLPLIRAILLLVILVLYFLLFLAGLLKSVIGWGTSLFVMVVEKIGTSYGITFTYDGFIGQEKYSILLELITFFVLMPYIVPFWLKALKKLIQAVVKSKELVERIFKIPELICSEDVLRCMTYMLLFFTSIVVYSADMSQPDDILSLVKEGLVEFVLLDTVISIFSKVKNKVMNGKKENIEME